MTTPSQFLKFCLPTATRAPQKLYIAVLWRQEKSPSYVRHEVAHAFNIYADVMLILAVIPSCRVSTPVISLATTFLAATFLIYGERIGHITVSSTMLCQRSTANTPLQIYIRHVPFAGQCSKWTLNFLISIVRQWDGTAAQNFNEITPDDPFSTPCQNILCHLYYFKNYFKPLFDSVSLYF